jgi:hypothetical protein
MISQVVLSPQVHPSNIQNNPAVSTIRRYLGDQLQPSEQQSLPAAAPSSFPGEASPVTYWFHLKDLLDQSTGIRYCAKDWKNTNNTIQCLADGLWYFMRNFLSWPSSDSLCVPVPKNISLYPTRRNSEAHFDIRSFTVYRSVGEHSYVYTLFATNFTVFIFWIKQDALDPFSLNL